MKCVSCDCLSTSPHKHGFCMFSGYCCDSCGHLATCPSIRKCVDCNTDISYQAPNEDICDRCLSKGIRENKNKSYDELYPETEEY